MRKVVIVEMLKEFLINVFYCYLICSLAGYPTVCTRNSFNIDSFSIYIPDSAWWWFFAPGFFIDIIFFCYVIVICIIACIIDFFASWYERTEEKINKQSERVKTHDLFSTTESE